MKKLTILYDAACGFCVKCRWWLAEQPKYVAMEFLPTGGPEARRRFPSIFGLGAPEELTVVSDDCGVYRGADAWLMCLWALEGYREWADRLARPALRPLARAAFALVSKNRGRISGWLGGAPDGELVARLREAKP